MNPQVTPLHGNQQFIEVPDDEAPEKSSSEATTALALALSRALSERAIVMMSWLLTLLTCGSVFWVWLSVPNPSPLQLVSLGVYAAFIFAVNWLVRRL